MNLTNGWKRTDGEETRATWRLGRVDPARRRPAGTARGAEQTAGFGPRAASYLTGGVFIQRARAPPERRIRSRLRLRKRGVILLPAIPILQGRKLK